MPSECIILQAYLTVMGLRASVFYTSHALFAFVKISAVILPAAVIILPLFVVSWNKMLKFDKVGNDSIQASSLIICCLFTRTLLIT